MGVRRYKDGNYFEPIRSGIACPICGKKDGRDFMFFNSQNELVYIACRNVESNTVISSSAGIYYKHFMNSENKCKGIIEKLPDLRKEENVELTFEQKKFRNDVYVAFRDAVKKYTGSYLYDEDRQYLFKRNYTEEIIEKMKVFSMPSKDQYVWNKACDRKIKLQTAIMNDLVEKFGAKNLLNVPGFIKLKNKNGGEYVTYKTCFKNKNKYEKIIGIMLPFIDCNSLICGVQFRLTIPVKDEKGKLLRYFWYSSKNARSGSVADVYVPKKLLRQDILLVTEGKLKGVKASEYLGVKAISLGGIGNTNVMKKVVSEMDKKCDLKHKVLLATDMDKKENEKVLMAEKNNIIALRTMDYEVAIIEWQCEKGIDDAIDANKKLTYKKCV